MNLFMNIMASEAFTVISLLNQCNTNTTTAASQTVLFYWLDGKYILKFSFYFLLSDIKATLKGKYTISSS
jgi:hypothetical protein